MTDQLYIHAISAILLSFGAIRPSKMGELYVFGWILDVTVSGIIVTVFNWILVDRLGTNSWLETGLVFVFALLFGLKTPLIPVLSRFVPKISVTTELRDRNLPS